MRKALGSFSRITFIIFILVVLIASWQYYEHVKNSQAEEQASPPVEIVKTIRYQFRVQNTSNEVIKDSQFIIYAPAHLDDRQEVISLSANRDFKLNELPSGNRSLLFTLDLLAPYASKQVVITAKLKLYDGAVKQVLSVEQQARFLREEAFIETYHPDIKVQADIIAQDTSQPLPRAIHKWVSDTVVDIGLVSANRGALYALQKQKGDCTEFMYLYSALARAKQIPTRNLGGFVLPQNGLLTASDYHNWAEFYDGKYWRIADGQKQVFDQGYDNYIIMRILGLNETQDDFSQSQRFLAFDPRLKVSMD